MCWGGGGSAYVCHGAHVDCRGRLWGVGSLLSTWGPSSLVMSVFNTPNYLANPPPSFYHPNSPFTLQNLEKLFFSCIWRCLFKDFFFMNSKTWKNFCRNLSALNISLVDDYATPHPLKQSIAQYFCAHSPGLLSPGYDPR